MVSGRLDVFNGFVIYNIFHLGCVYQDVTASALLHLTRSAPPGLCHSPQTQCSAERDRVSFQVFYFPNDCKSWDWDRQKLRLGLFLGPLLMCQGPKCLSHHLLLSQRHQQRSYIEYEVARLGPSSDTGFRCCKLQVNTLGHNACPIKLILIMDFKEPAVSKILISLPYTQP